MKVTVSNTITIGEPTEEVKKWCKTNLTIRNPEYAKKVRMHLWLGKTPPTLALYEQRGDTLVLPFGTLRRLLTAGIIPRGTEYIKAFADPVSIDYGVAVPLYDYQQEAVEQVYAKHYGILQAPAGCGKTQVGIALVKKFGKRALWLTHTLDLLNQSKKRAEQYMGSDLIGTITGGKVNIGKGVTFATVQTMCRLDFAQYKDYWDVLVVDECHRCCGGPTATTQFYRVLSALAARHKIGLTATAHRADGLIEAMYSLLGEVVHTVPDEAVRERVMDVGIQPIATNVERSWAYAGTDGTLNHTKLMTYLCEHEERNRLISERLVQEREHSLLILSARVGHLERLRDSLPEDMREDSAVIDGTMVSKTDKARREQVIEDMRTGKKRYLFATYNLAREGLDIPCLERLVMATPIKDFAWVVQSVGRVARTQAGKEAPIVLDFVDDQIRFCVAAYKERLKHYKKAGCYMCE